MCLGGDVLRSQEEGETPQEKIPPLPQDFKGKDVAGSQDINLKRELGLFSAVSLIISVMIGETQIIVLVIFLVERTCLFCVSLCSC